MDLALYARVIWRFRLIVAAGVVLAVVLSALSYRTATTWQSTETLLVTQRGFPQGRTVLPGGTSSGQGSSGHPALGTTFADPQRFSQLALFYSQLANSDAVQLMVARRGLKGAMTAQPAVLGNSLGGGLLPFITILGTAAGPQTAVRIAEEGASAFQRYLDEQQTAAAIPINQRVVVQVVNRARDAVILQGPKKTLPVVIFLTVLIAALGLAFVLENLRPRLRLVSSQTDEVEHPAQSRRGA